MLNNLSMADILRKFFLLYLIIYALKLALIYEKGYGAVAKIKATPIPWVKMPLTSVETTTFEQVEATLSDPQALSTWSTTEKSDPTENSHTKTNDISTDIYKLSTWSTTEGMKIGGAAPTKPEDSYIKGPSTWPQTTGSKAIEITPTKSVISHTQTTKSDTDFIDETLSTWSTTTELQATKKIHFPDGIPQAKKRTLVSKASNKSEKGMFFAYIQPQPSDRRFSWGRIRSSMISRSLENLEGEFDEHIAWDRNAKTTTNSPSTALAILRPRIIRSTKKSFHFLQRLYNDPMDALFDPDEFTQQPFGKGEDSEDYIDLRTGRPNSDMSYEEIQSLRRLPLKEKDLVKFPFLYGCCRNSTYIGCAGVCPETCEYRSKYCVALCGPPCRCNHGYVYNIIAKACTLREECPPGIVQSKHGVFRVFV